MEDHANVAEDVESITREYLEIFNAVPLDSDAANFVWDGFREYLQSRYESTQEILYLQGAIEIARMATETITPLDKQWLRQLQILGSLVFDRYMRTKTLKDLEEAICAVQECINASVPDYPGLADFRYRLGFLLGSKFHKLRDMADLDKAICIFQDVINTIPPNDIHQEEYFNAFMFLMEEKYDFIKEKEGIEEAICLGQSFVDGALPSRPERVVHLVCLAKLYHAQLLDRQDGYHDRHDYAQQLRDTIDQAVSLAQEANDTVPLMNPVFVKSQCVLHLGRRYQIFGEKADLEEAIWMSFEAVENCPLDNEQRLSLLRMLVAELGLRGGSTRAFEDIDDAVTMAQETIALLPNEHPRRNEMLYELGISLLARYSHAGMLADVDESIQVFQDPLYSAALGPEKHERLLRLALCFDTRYRRTGLQSDLEESICLTCENIESTPLDHPSRTNLLLNLANSLTNRFTRTGVLRDVDEAIQIYRYSLAGIPPNKPDLRIGVLTDLSSNLGNRFFRTSALSDLNESIDLVREALELVSHDRVYRSNFLYSLATSLANRYNRTKEIGDLNEAITLYREALELAPSINYLRTLQLHNLSIALSQKFKASEDTADLEEAILMSQKAINIVDPIDHQMRSIVFQQHSGLLYDKYGQTRAKAHLNEAIHIGELALHEIPQVDPQRAGNLCNLGNLLHWRFCHVQMMADIIMISGGPNHSSIDPVMKQLKYLEIFTAIELHDTKLPLMKDVSEFIDNEKHFCLEALSDLKKSREYFVEALYLESATVKDRFQAGRSLMLTSLADSPDSYNLAKYTVDLIPLLASRSLPNSDKQSVWTAANGVSSLAAAVALNKLPPERGPLAAIECLEIGRGLVAGGIIEQYDISALQKHHPELGGSFCALQDRISNPFSQEFFSTINGTASKLETKDYGHNKPEQETLNELLEMIRSKPNFQRFRLPPSEHDMLQAAACGGPIVMLNLGLNRCDALLIEQSGLRVLELSHLSLQNGSLRLLAKHTSSLESLDTLAWLWDDIVCPVLNALGFTEPPAADESWPHVWWIPTGVLAKLPLHAAGHHMKRSGETTFDRVISSYATSVKALIHSRRRGAPIAEEPFNVVAVAMKETDGQATLENADCEVDAIFNILRSKTINCRRPDPIRDTVLENIKSSQIFHFAGHGETHSYDPLQSKLLLEDWKQKPLTVASLLETDFGSNSPFLAYLSACGTGQIHRVSSGDESIHLANAFQLAGFRHVIGTLWSVKDESCVEIAELTYKSLCRSEKIRDDTVSRGLHDAVREVRDRWVDMANEYAETESDDDMEPESRGSDESRAARHGILMGESEELAKPLWIPYVHFGA